MKSSRTPTQGPQHTLLQPALLPTQVWATFTPDQQTHLFQQLIHICQIIATPQVSAEPELVDDE